MKLDTRLKKLENNISSQNRIWATFTMKSYEDPIQQAKVKQQLLDQYLAAGNAPPIGCIYWNELCPELAKKDKFTGNYPTNPIAAILENISVQARDPLHDAV
jgi:hypothetical protein